MSRGEDVHHLQTQTIYIQPGLTLATLISQEPEQLSMTLKHMSGGSLHVIGVTLGLTLTGTSLVSAVPESAYICSLNEVINIDGPARFYLASLGSTATVTLIRGKSSHGGV